MIETKSSARSIDNAKAHITRNEFEKAKEHENYIFHFWLLKDQKLAALSRELVIDTAPKNKNEGIWEEFTVPFITFKNYFKEVDLN